MARLVIEIVNRPLELKMLWSFRYDYDPEPLRLNSVSRLNTQHLFSCLNSCDLRKICVSMLVLTPWRP